MKNASLFLNFLKVFFKEKKKRSGREEKIDKKMQNKERAGPRVMPCRLFVQKDGGNALAFCIFRVEKRAVPLEGETAL